MRYETYQSNLAEIPVMRKWFFRALIVSLAFHGALFLWFRSTRLERFNPPTARLRPLAFTVNRVVIDPRLLEAEESASPASLPEKRNRQAPDMPLPEERPSIEQSAAEVRAAPDVTETLKPILSEKPRVEAAAVETLARVRENAARSMERELDALHAQLLNDRPEPDGQPLLKANASPEHLPAGNNTDAAAMAEATGRLNDLLGRGLGNGDAPLQLPGGALFAFDSAELTEAAIVLMKKVALLIQNNPGVIFTIEGYTDSFGSPEHNLDLSQRRAEAVKAWLTAYLAENKITVPPAHIRAQGYGSSHFKVPPRNVDHAPQTVVDAEIARQQPNRRVELVFQIPVRN